MDFAKQHKTFLIREYTENNQSTYWISEQLSTYPNKIRRALKYLGVQLKDKSQAQKFALSSGRHSHPTKGRQRTEDERTRISNSMASYWVAMSDDERENRVKLGKEQWANMTEQERQDLRSMAAEAVRKAGKEGSKLERFIREKLTLNGYDVSFHKKGLVPGDKLEIDLYIPSLKTAIEIDGPAHFLPIWGEENLQKNIKSDAKKSGLILSMGFVMIRIKHVKRSVSEKTKRETLALILSQLDKIKDKFPTKPNRYIELEV